MFGGATGVTDTTSGRLFLAPAPDDTYVFKIHYEAIPDGLSSSNALQLILVNTLEMVYYMLV
jgi:hypothetical protein